ncbi:MAG: 7-carboxy-7-deazaguanine synthase QueE [Deltaproteobacteria bacterium]|nr:7-carboxy-7-deazaguanine synthase QueE [Deltaproteobacteria bacterium]
MIKARIIEIFSSIQGEGLWVGRPQVFVRFHGCKLQCGYCDTPLTHHKISKARIEFPPYSRQFENHSLEFTPDELTQAVHRFGVPSVAITGGEPLEQADFIRDWLPGLEGYQILLETSGVETEALEKVIAHVDLVSLDIKIPSATGERAYWEEHDRFIQVARSKECYAKVVYDERMIADEQNEILKLMRKHETVPFVFQPVSPLQKRDMKKCLEIFAQFSQAYPMRARLIPQVHKFLGIL